MNDFMKDEQLTMRQINNFENYYACQNGMIYNSKTHKYCNPICDGKNGRDFVLLQKDNKEEPHYIDELIAEAFIEKPGCIENAAGEACTDDFFVCHKQGVNIYENQYYNLAWYQKYKQTDKKADQKEPDIDREAENQTAVVETRANSDNEESEQIEDGDKEYKVIKSIDNDQKCYIDKTNALPKDAKLLTKFGKHELKHKMYKSMTTKQLFVEKDNNVIEECKFDFYGKVFSYQTYDKDNKLIKMSYKTLFKCDYDKPEKQENLNEPEKIKI